MANYYVKFRHVDDTFYSGKYDKYDLDMLLKEINKVRFITLPDEMTILNLDHITRIEIENMSK
jgi:hypothetical protein